MFGINRLAEQQRKHRAQIQELQKALIYQADRFDELTSCHNDVVHAINALIARADAQEAPKAPVTGAIAQLARERYSAEQEKILKMLATREHDTVKLEAVHTEGRK